MAKGKGKAPDTTAAVDELFGALQRTGTPIEGQGDRTKLTLEKIGDYFVGRLRKIGKSAKPNDRGEHFLFYHVDGPNGEAWYFTGSFDFDSRVTGEHVGKVLAVRLVELLPMDGKPSPMKLYEIVDCGSSFPKLNIPATNAADELPF